MKRLSLLAAVVILASLWPKPARAQLGIPNVGIGLDMGSKIQNQTSQVKQKKRYLPPPPAAGLSRRLPSRSMPSNPGFSDRSGRIDMAGKPVAGYPAVRGSLSGSSAPKISRGGANGPAKARTSPRRTTVPNGY
jgi:phage tail tape-measure protein